MLFIVFNFYYCNIFQVEDCALQIYRQCGTGGSSEGDFGTYLDSDLSLSEQPDELDLLKNR